MIKKIINTVMEALKKCCYFLGIFPNQGAGVGIPNLYVKFWWP